MLQYHQQDGISPALFSPSALLYILYLTVSTKESSKYLETGHTDDSKAGENSSSIVHSSLIFSKVLVKTFDFSIVVSGLTLTFLKKELAVSYPVNTRPSKIAARAFPSSAH